MVTVADEPVVYGVSPRVGAGGDGRAVGAALRQAVLHGAAGSGASVDKGLRAAGVGQRIRRRRRKGGICLNDCKCPASVRQITCRAVAVARSNINPYGVGAYIGGAGDLGITLIILYGDGAHAGQAGHSCSLRVPVVSQVRRRNKGKVRCRRRKERCPLCVENSVRGERKLISRIVIGTGAVRTRIPASKGSVIRAKAHIVH